MEFQNLFNKVNTKVDEDVNQSVAWPNQLMQHLTIVA
jgi:hypothetical protein